MEIQRTSTLGSSHVARSQYSFRRRPSKVFLGLVFTCLVGLLSALPPAAHADCCQMASTCGDMVGLGCTTLGGTEIPGWSCVTQCSMQGGFPVNCVNRCVAPTPTPGPPTATPTPTATAPPPSPSPVPPCCMIGGAICAAVDPGFCATYGGVVGPAGSFCADECGPTGCITACRLPSPTPTPTSTGPTATATPSPSTTATPRPNVCCDLSSPFQGCINISEQTCTSAGGVPAPDGYICAGSQQCIPPNSTPTPTPVSVCCEVNIPDPVCAETSAAICASAGGTVAPPGYVCSCGPNSCLGQCVPPAPPTASETPADTPTATPTATATPTPTSNTALCGNGAVEANEECDDGNTAPDDGCDATCAIEPGCPPAVDPSCRAPITAGKASIARASANPGDKNKLQWKWLAGSATDKTDFGDPLTSDGYLVCLYDGSGLRATLRAPAAGTCGTKPCWRDVSYGYLYKDKDGTPNGIHVLQLKQGTDGKARIKVKAKGANVPMPLTSSLLSPLTVQLRRASGGPCWGASYAAPYDKDDGVVLTDKAD
jgi:cysteine-rich repeat protein